MFIIVLVLFYHISSFIVLNERLITPHYLLHAYVWKLTCYTDLEMTLWPSPMYSAPIRQPWKLGGVYLGSSIFKLSYTNYACAETGGKNGKKFWKSCSLLSCKMTFAPSNWHTRRMFLFSNLFFPVFRLLFSFRKLDLNAY